MKTAIILSNGSSKRWRKDHSFPKQLADINGEQLIVRTIRQLQEFGIDKTWVASNDPQTRKAVLGKANMWYPEDDTKWLTQTILTTRPLWADLMFLPFGDVCWEDGVLEEIILSMNDSFHAFGNIRVGETFGFSFGPSDFLKMEEALKSVTASAIKSRCYGWMGTATYRTYAGLELSGWGQMDSKGIWVDIPGWTKDIDDSDNYRKMLLAMKGEHVW